MDKNYDNVDITNDFMFSYVMRQPDICMELLEYLLPECKIRKVDYITEDNKIVSSDKIEAETQKTLAETFGKKGVRLDVYLDDGKTVYNVEMQTTEQLALPKRARFYQAQIDINLLNRGVDYDKLRPCFIIFICKFDPFGKGQYRYTFRNMCDEKSGMELHDETYKLFFNTAGTKGEISSRLRELLHYMNSTASYPVNDTNNSLIKKIDEAVSTAKQSDEWRRAYMVYSLHEYDAEKRGEAKGRTEGLQEGLQKGRAEGEKEGAIQTTVEIYQEFGKSFADIVATLVRKFGLTAADSHAMVTKYWKPC